MVFFMAAVPAEAAPCRTCFGLNPRCDGTNCPLNVVVAGDTVRSWQPGLVPLDGDDPQAAHDTLRAVCRRGRSFRERGFRGADPGSLLAMDMQWFVPF